MFSISLPLWVYYNHYKIACRATTNSLLRVMFSISQPVLVYYYNHYKIVCRATTARRATATRRATTVLQRIFQK